MYSQNIIMVNRSDGSWQALCHTHLQLWCSGENITQEVRASMIKSEVVQGVTCASHVTSQSSNSFFLRDERLQPEICRAPFSLETL